MPTTRSRREVPISSQSETLVADSLRNARRVARRCSERDGMGKGNALPDASPTSQRAA
jgi:hypothetical protein